MAKKSHTNSSSHSIFLCRCKHLAAWWFCHLVRGKSHIKILNESCFYFLFSLSCLLSLSPIWSLSEVAWQVGASFSYDFSVFSKPQLPRLDYSALSHLSSVFQNFVEISLSLMVPLQFSSLLQSCTSFIYSGKDSV